jgi:hypothetical protein
LKTKSTHPGERKKNYKRPTLTTYGDIRQLTKTAAGECRDNENAFNNAQPGAGYTCS